MSKILSYNMKILINRLAEEVISYYDIQHPIIKIEKVIEQLGGELFLDDNKARYGNVIEIKDNKHFSYFYSNQYYYSVGHKNRDFAEDIGHLFMKLDYGDNENTIKVLSDFCKTDYCVEKIDKEMATEFALCFLMPEKLFKDTINRYTRPDGKIPIEKVSEFFNVTNMDAIKRGRFLNVLQW